MPYSIEAQMTQMLIDDFPTEISFVRTELVDDGQGGQEELPSATLAPQQCRLITSGLIAGAQQMVRQDANVVNLKYTIVAMPDFDVKVGDIFVYDGERMKVSIVKKIQDWSIEAGVTTIA